MRMARKCCVPSCEADVQEVQSQGLPIHPFPKDINLRSKWLESAGFESTFKPTSNQVICHRHFKRTDYEPAAKGHKFLLRKDSVPSIFTHYDNDTANLQPSLEVTCKNSCVDVASSEISNPIESIASSRSMFGNNDDCLKKEPCWNSFDSPEMMQDSVNNHHTGNNFENELQLKEEMDDSKIKVDDVAIQLGIAESGMDVRNYAKNLPNERTTELKTKLGETRKHLSPHDLKSKASNKGSLHFFPGARLEAKDFNEKWYSAKVVETDWAEQEVLIHFDKWSSRFDEWIPMDSSRLRVLQAQPKEIKGREFAVGEKILATWVDGRKYPAKVNAVLGNDRYDVLFDDGYAKIIRSSKMTKVIPTTKPLSQGENYIGSKQERRDKKRKHSVMELFHTHSRKRSKHDPAKLQRKEETIVGDASIYRADSHQDGTMFAACYDSGTDLLRGFDTSASKMKTYLKKMKKETPGKTDTNTLEDVGPEWIDGEPQGVESYIVDGNDGPRRSIIVADKRLPPGWQKHFTQRKAGTSAGKWDVLFIHNSSGKKFRSRNDIRAFMENQGQYNFDPEQFDFCIHRKKKPQTKSKQDTVALEMPKKIKTLSPKTRIPPLIENNLNNSGTPATSPMLPVTSSSTVDDGAVFIGGLRVEMEDSAFKCPKEGCLKNFRKENLLQMHIKHYHPEYSRFLGSTPNVADLAYARTIGEPLEEVMPKKLNNSIDKMKLGKRKLVQENRAGSSPLLTSNSPRPISSPLVSLEFEDSGTDAAQGGNDIESIKEEINEYNTELPYETPNTEDLEMKRENSCSMSPDTLFDMKIKEEKTQIGIKTLFPVRPANNILETQRTDRSQSLDETVQVEKTKGQRKRHISEYISDHPIKGKRHESSQEFTAACAHTDDSILDADSLSEPPYRYNRPRSDCKSDENSQNSQLDDPRLEKCVQSKEDNTRNHDTEASDGVMMMISGELVKVEQLRREEIINCTCGFMEEDGLMIQCDLCLCWQHGHCNAIEREKDVPEKYICYICQHPHRQRPSKKYFHDQDWIKEGKLPCLPSRRKNQNAINQRTAMLKRSYDLVAALLQIQEILHSLRVKIDVAQKKDHPKLYLWAKSWEKVPMLQSEQKEIPVMEIIKPSALSPDSHTDVSRPVTVKTESKLPVDDENDDKSIASDSELMKILEEGSTNSEESKVTCKNGDTTTRGDGHILLDALMRDNCSDDQQNSIVPQSTKIKTEESTEESLSDSPSTLDQNPVLPKAESNVLDMENQIPTMTVLQPCIPEPEAPIDPTECCIRLLDHIEHFQNHIDSRLKTIEAHVCALEAIDCDESPPAHDVQPRTKQTIQMLLRDLNTVRKLAALC